MKKIRREFLIEALTVVLAATLANFLWHWCYDSNWMEALKISYFQAISVFYFAWKVS